MAVRDSAAHPFCMVPMALIRDPSSCGQHIALYAALRSELDFVKAGQDPSGKVSLRRVYELLAWSPKTGRKWVKELAAMGWIYIHESGSQGTLVIVHHEPVENV